jgi:hypothetical protein
MTVDDAAFAQLEALHPPGPQAQPFLGVHNPPAQVTAQLLYRGIASMKATSAPGFDGWTPGLLQTVCGVHPDRKQSDREAAADAGGGDAGSAFTSPLGDLLVEMAQAMLGSAFPESLWMRTGRLVAIPKGGGGVRPIAMAPVFLRAISAALLRAAPLRSRITALQYGVGRGAETMIHRVRAKVQLQHPAAVFKLDL